MGSILPQRCLSVMAYTVQVAMASPARCFCITSHVSWCIHHTTFFGAVSTSEQLHVCLQALSTAITIHHEVLRAQLTKYKGVEMQIDGDAVLLGFRDPVSATAWCLATQQVPPVHHIARQQSIQSCFDQCILLEGVMP